MRVIEAHQIQKHCGGMNRYGCQVNSERNFLENFQDIEMLSLLSGISLTNKTHLKSIIGLKRKRSYRKDGVFIR